MKQFLAGFILSAAICGVTVLTVVLPQVRESYHSVGFNDGLIAARSEAARGIREKLGTDVDVAEGGEVLFTAKAAAVVFVERNGVKTLRVVE